MPGQLVISEPAAGAAIPLWRFEYATLAGTALAEVTNVRSRRLTYQLNAPTTVEFTMNLLDPAMDDLLTNPHGLVKCYKRGVLRMVAEVTSLQLVGREGERSIRVLATEAPWIRLEKRLIGQAVNGAYYEAMDRAAIVVAALKEVNDIADTKVKTGSIAATSIATAGPFYFKPVGELIRDLGLPLNGYDWWYSPADPATDGAVGYLNISPLRGALRNDAIFEFGIGRTNVREYELQIDAQQIITRAISLPPSFPDNLGLEVVSAPKLDYRQLVVDDSPAHYWRLGETSGTEAKDEMDINGGTYVGFTGEFDIKNSPLGAIEGDPNKSKFFDGINDYITMGYTPFTQGSTRTFEGWAMLTVTTSTLRLLFASATATTANACICQIRPSDLSFVFNPVNTDTPSEWIGAWPGKNRWVHWALIFNDGANTTELFINGESKGIRTQAKTYNAAPGNLRIGSMNATSSRWQGRMDEFAVYESALTASQIREHAIQSRSQGISATLGQREEVIEADLADADLRQLLVDEHVAVRTGPRNVFVFQPHVNDDTGRVPSFLEDYDIGDIIRGRVNDSNLVVLDGLVRVYGAVVELDDEGTEAVTLTLVDEA